MDVTQPPQVLSEIDGVKKYIDGVLKKVVESATPASDIVCVSSVLTQYKMYSYVIANKYFLQIVEDKIGTKVWLLDNYAYTRLSLEDHDIIICSIFSAVKSITSPTPYSNSTQFQYPPFPPEQK